MNIFEKFTTLKGESLLEALARLDSELPAAAYVEGAGKGYKYTEIDAAYCIELMTDVFGPYGIGWWYIFADENVETHQVPAVITTKDKKQLQGTHWCINVRRLLLHYAYLDGDNVRRSEPAIGVGGRSGPDSSDCLKGAVTSAMKNAIKDLGFQASVYKNLRTHNTVGKGQQTNKKPPSPRQDSPPKNQAAGSGKPSSKNTGADNGKGSAKPAAPSQLDAVRKQIDRLKKKYPEAQRVEDAKLKFDAVEDKLTFAEAAKWIKTLNDIDKQLEKGEDANVG